MQTLIDGHRLFESDAFPGDRDLYSELGHTHKPPALFIGCSDARVVPEIITSRGPGDLFVIRTAGNLIPHPEANDGIAASIEYAVEVLDVQEIVVCGHSACGAMTALALNHDLSVVPAVARWLATAGHVRTDTASSDDERVRAAVRSNVERQLANLAEYPSVHTRRSAGSLTLSGWVHDIASGAVEVITLP
ncbi:carbonic anhydrase [Curtobacterium citreum]|uniref:carbonic anhydrase n=1 Tax=Curtobacterium citreum TaxID=2036 RepID=UPI00254F70DB|nr:carbonic anhydrase [Curtobacterium citreum]MDK8172271.1 carbonic anhydrase [Curtobacterium citreum]